MAITVADLAIELRLSVDGLDLDDAQTTVLNRLVIVLLMPLWKPTPAERPIAVRRMKRQSESVAYLYDVPAGKGMACPLPWRPVGRNPF